MTILPIILRMAKSIGGRSMTACFVLAFILLASAGATQAAGASLGLYPSAGSYSVGSQINVSVIISSSATSINAAEGTIKFDPTVLDVVAISKSGSIFTLWITEPTFSNAAGTINFGGGSQQGFLGSSGKILSVTFHAKMAGSTAVNFTSSAVLAADGAGTNVLTAANGGTYLVAAPQTVTYIPTTEIPAETKPQTPTAAAGSRPNSPAVGSDTHPDQEKWYNNNDPSLNWTLPEDATAVMIGIDHETDSIPGKLYSATTSSKSLEDLEDGVWYFHVRIKNAAGWGGTAHYKVMIDTKEPDKLDLSIDNGGDTTNPQPILNLTGSDSGSGVTEFEIVVDDNTASTGAENNITTDYQLPAGEHGNHKVFVTARDWAGNSKTGSIDFDIEALDSPIINSVDSEVHEDDAIVVNGTSIYPDAAVDLKLTSTDGAIISAQVKTDSRGSWSYQRVQGFKEGSYVLIAGITDKRGAKSGESQPIVINVMPRSGLCAFSGSNSWMLILAALLFVTGLFVMFDYRRRMKSETLFISRRIEQGFAELRGELDKNIRNIDGNPELSENEVIFRAKLMEMLNEIERSILRQAEDSGKKI